MKKLIILFLIFSSYGLQAQDIIFFKNGDEIKARIIEVADTMVFYKKFQSDDSTLNMVRKSFLLFIKYSDGSKRMFLNDTTAKTPAIETHAKIYLYWPNNFLGSAATFLVMANDSFLIKVKSGFLFYYETFPKQVTYSTSIRNEKATLTVQLNAGETYYIKCLAKNKGLIKNIPRFELMDKSTGAKETAKMQETFRIFGKKKK